MYKRQAIPTYSWIEDALPNGIRHDLLPLFLIVILYGVIVLKLFNRFFTNKWVTFIGSICYSLYLIHFMIISVAGKYTLLLRITDVHWINFIVQTLLLTPLCLMGGYIFYRLIERPALIWRRNYLARKKLSEPLHVEV